MIWYVGQSCALSNRKASVKNMSHRMDRLNVTTSKNCELTSSGPVLDYGMGPPNCLFDIYIYTLRSGLIDTELIASSPAAGDSHTAQLVVKPSFYSRLAMAPTEIATIAENQHGSAFEVWNCLACSAGQDAPPLRCPKFEKEIRVADCTFVRRFSDTVQHLPQGGWKEIAETLLCSASASLLARMGLNPPPVADGLEGLAITLVIFLMGSGLEDHSFPFPA